MKTNLLLARAVADAVLYEGYLLYPYRASAVKNQARWQFGILGPPGAAAAGTGEDARMSADCLLAAGPGAGVEVHLRFLQLQTRTVEQARGGGFEPVDELTVGPSHWLSWDEAVEQEIVLGPFPLADLQDPERQGLSVPVAVPGGRDTELLAGPGGTVAGRLVRRRRALSGEVRLHATAAGTGPAGPLLRLRVAATNTGAATAGGRTDAIAASFIGTHLLLGLRDGDFLSLLEPPEAAAEVARACAQHRCWPVLAGPEGQSDVLLVSPIILYDHPAVAPESPVALYDATEIDEILTLRVLTLTDEEKAEARATDPRAAAVIERCEALSAEELQQLHGVLRDPRAGSGAGPDPGGGRPWWHPEADASVRPDTDAVVIDGVPVSRGSRVRVHPRRRADAQDLFFAGQTARVTSVHFDVDGSTHVGLVLERDPAADLHEGYGRSFYYAPEELEPLDRPQSGAQDSAGSATGQGKDTS
ncbi:hypothetical protein LVY72_13325 [Arthrobacter sp. I2-34]|uniref:Uncharacterized protein n=1 Tax=Arthrobacter hankyongi TaxID=2904801 RepID=A0ABS9L8C7_9MICC|nr:hypothetical protein [Arthrobacter hankyongi]MCG2622881.1 hypothetical protein [Arthrobacter hankyongi]